MATDGLMPRVAALLLLLLALALTPRAQAQHCGHAEGEEVLEKLERRFARCLGENAHLEALDKLASAFTTNEFDRQAPLALALFSNSSDALDALASVVATSLFDAPPAPHAVQLVDVEELLWHANSGERASNYEVKQALRSALAAPLRSCSARSLFVVRNVQALDDAALPVMDVFLDPLNGKRAQFQSGHAVLDCTNAVFLFLFHIGTEPSAEDASGIPINDSLLWTGNGKSTWREFLMRKWTRPVETHSAEEFTPQALVGRITDGITLMTSSLFTAAGDCRIQLSQQDQRGNEASSRDSNGDDQAVQLWTIVLVAVLALLHIIKSWNEVTAQRREQREHREPWGPIKRRKAKQPKAKKK